MSRSVASLLYWSPRTLAIAFAVFLSAFALDVFNEAHGFGPVLVAFSIHIVPAVIVVAVLIAAWRWEWIGAVLFASIAAIYAWSVLPGHVSWVLTIDLPLLAIAALFLVNWIERAQLGPARMRFP